MTFKPTETIAFEHGKTRVVVEIENSDQRHAWRMIVNGKPSDVTSFYPGILVLEGFGLVTDYWRGNLPVMTPFKITPARKTG